MTAIDWGLIAEFEGGLILRGYVPDPEGSQSGVTVAVGVDLGQWSAPALRRIGVSERIVEILLPYFGRKRQDAVDALSRQPLTLRKADAEELTRRVKQSAVDTLHSAYDRAVHRNGLRFESLPSECQTVIMSVGFQYGHLASQTPNFWRQVTEQRWADATANLMHFGDRYRTRRRREAAVLQTVLAKKGTT